jgi:hypothetical protein
MLISYSVWQYGLSAEVVAAALSGKTLSFAKMGQMLERERQISEKLRQALPEIKVLETFLQICVECKMIRDKDGDWQQQEVYNGKNANTQFSYGYCPECEKRVLEADGLGA